MPELFAGLTTDAEDIANSMLQNARSAAAERQQIAKRLAEIEDIEKAAQPVPERLRRLREIYKSGRDPLCPSCFLEGRADSILVAASSPEPESFDVHRCRVCDFHGYSSA